MTAATVLAPLDGSTQSEAALGYAQALAGRLGAGMVLFSVVPDPGDRLSAEAEELAQRLCERQYAAATRYLQAVSERLRAAGCDVETRVVVGDPAAAILRAATRPGVAAIAMATHGRGGVERLLIGSVADKVMRLCRKPVLLTRTDGAATPASLGFRRIAVPLDDTATAKAALRPASRLLAPGGELVLMRAEPLLSAVYGLYAALPDLQTAENAVGAEAHDALERARRRVPAGVQVRTLVVRGFPQQVLPGVVERENIELTVLSTHGYGGVHRILVGSVADTLVRAGLPVLLLHPRARRGVRRRARTRIDGRTPAPARLAQE